MMPTGVDDILLLLGVDQALAFSHLEVALPAPYQLEQQANTVLLVPRHLLIKLGHATLHHDALLLAEQRALLATILRITWVNACICRQCGIDIQTYQPAQALLAQRTLVVETYQVVAGLFAKRFFFFFSQNRFCRIHLCKDTNKRAQYKTKTNFFVFIAERKYLLAKRKVTNKRAQYKTKNIFLFYCRAKVSSSLASKVRKIF